MTSPSPTEPIALGQQTLTLTGLRFDANLGILETEMTAPQPIQPDAVPMACTICW